MSSPDPFSNPTKNFLLYFCISVVLFATIGNGISSLFWDYAPKFFAGLTQTPEELLWIWRLLLVMILISILFLIIYRSDLLSWLKQSILTETFNTEVYQNITSPFPAVIAVMSKINDPTRESVAEIVIRYHWDEGKNQNFKYCWLICTKDSEDSAKALIDKLKEDYGKDQKDQPNFFYGDQYQLEDINNPHNSVSLRVPDEKINDPIYIQQLIDCIYFDAEIKGIKESEIIADFTGGTRSMGTGIVLACTSPQRRLQYICQLGEEGIEKIKEIQINFKLKAQKPINYLNPDKSKN